jgi:hypothetical protein
MAAPDLELDVKARPPPKPRRKEIIEDSAPLELAIDPRSLVQERSEAHAAAPMPGMPSPLHAPAPLARVQPATPQARPSSLPPPSNDLEADARLLADYGDAPSSPLLAPVYAWKVFKRQRELKAALTIRKTEAEHASRTLEDALVALAERARPVAEKHNDYSPLIDELKRAEELLRSRDRVLAAEQDAQKGRLAQVDARISTAESELAQAQGRERAAATELAGAQGALAREEAKIKRAEAELRAVQQRDGAGGTR